MYLLGRFPASQIQLLELIRAGRLEVAEIGDLLERIAAFIYRIGRRALTVVP